MLRLLADQYEAARRRLPSAVFDYIDGGAGDELARDEAERAWSAYRLLPRVLRDVRDVDAGCELLGQRLRTPLLVGPTASHALVVPESERVAARAAAAAGSLLVVSTRSSLPVEEIAAVAGPWWLQVYVTRDPGVTEGLVRRAAAAGASALVLTGDTPVVGRKARQGRLESLAADVASANLGRHLAPGADPAVALEQDPGVTTAAIGWLAGLSGLPVLVKGVLHPDDVRSCVDAGAAGLIVSNHGGRQVARAVSTASALPGVVAAAGGRVPVLVDGGIRSGSDAVVALALGAAAVLLGRPVLWALAAGGGTGLEQALSELTADLAHVLQLLGARSLAELDAGYLAP